MESGARGGAETRICCGVSADYRGRIAPTPTGYLHAGHALTFRTAFDRCRAQGGRLVLRVEDIDVQRCRPEFTAAAVEDLEWLGIACDEGPIFQSSRREAYLAAWRVLRDGGWIYPCHRSRRDLAVLAPHEEEPVFPVEWRGDSSVRSDTPEGANWRFRVPDGETICFEDGRMGWTERMALRDFGDFVVWNRDNIPAYELAVVVDDIANGITEIVRGADLLTSTARQILIYRALGAKAPATFHTPLVMGPDGRRLAKRAGGWSLRDLRRQGTSAADVLALAARSQDAFLPFRDAVLHEVPEEE